MAAAKSLLEVLDDEMLTACEKLGDEAISKLETTKTKKQVTVNGVKKWIENETGEKYTVLLKTESRPTVIGETDGYFIKRTIFLSAVPKNGKASPGPSTVNAFG